MSLLRPMESWGLWVEGCQSKPSTLQRRAQGASPSPSVFLVLVLSGLGFRVQGLRHKELVRLPVPFSCLFNSVQLNPAQSPLSLWWFNPV
jgi:hypothetical protein